MNRTDLLAEYDQMFIRSCENKGMSGPDIVAALLEDEQRIAILNTMVHAEATKTHVIMKVEPSDPIFNEMILNRKEPTEGKL